MVSSLLGNQVYYGLFDYTTEKVFTVGGWGHKAIHSKVFIELEKILSTPIQAGFISLSEQEENNEHVLIVKFDVASARFEKELMLKHIKKETGFSLLPYEQFPINGKKAIDKSKPISLRTGQARKNLFL